MPSFQKAFFRNIVALIAVTVFMLIKKEKFLPSKQGVFPILGRSVFGLIGLVLNFIAIDHLNIADAAILNKMSPFFTVIFAAMFLKEKITKIDVLFLLIAFSGALFVVKPSFDFSSVYSYFGLCSGLSVGVAYTFLRLCGTRGERGTKIVFWFSAFSTVVLTPLFIIYYQPMTPTQLTYMCLAGVCAAIAQFFVTAAYTKAKAKEVSVFDYSQVIFAALLGFFVLGQTPDVFSFIGYAVIITVAIVKWIVNAKADAKLETLNSESNKKTTYRSVNKE